jgi:UDP-glucuronate 4-epimerase
LESVLGFLGNGMAEAVPRGVQSYDSTRKLPYGREEGRCVENSRGAVLVTGAAGFIGARVSELLVESGYAVVGVDNLNDAYDVRLKRWRLDRLSKHSAFVFRPVDICDRRALAGVFDAAVTGRRPCFDAVVNLAARAGVRQSLEHPQAYLETNVIGTLNLLDHCRASGVQKFILASSSSLYGVSTTLPFREDADTNHPISPYAASKKAAEVLCYSYHHHYAIDVTVLRYFTVYGPAGRPDMSPFRFVQWIAEGRPVTLYGGGVQSRDFTFIDDIARGTIAGLKPLGYEVINLGSDRPIIMNDAVRMIERLVGRTANVEHRPGHPADVPATRADISRARTLLGWQPETSYEDGMAELVRWYRENREWASEIRTT